MCCCWLLTLLCLQGERVIDRVLFTFVNVGVARQTQEHSSTSLLIIFGPLWSGDLLQQFII